VRVDEGLDDLGPGEAGGDVSELGPGGAALAFNGVAAEALGGFVVEEEVAAAGGVAAVREDGLGEGDVIFRVSFMPLCVRVYAIPPSGASGAPTSLKARALWQSNLAAATGESAANGGSTPVASFCTALQPIVR
jgi:hypothetical protein